MCSPGLRHSRKTRPLRKTLTGVPTGTPGRPGHTGQGTLGSRTLSTIGHLWNQVYKGDLGAVLQIVILLVKLCCFYYKRFQSLHLSTLKIVKMSLRKSCQCQWIVNVYVVFSSIFDDPADVVNLIYGSSVFSKSSLNILEFPLQVLLKPGLKNFEHYFTSE